ncbi:hypothetical protein Kisp01_67880 [Kineosporia sp. NBRC 101677]|nr:hypothetical protein Kisp01_67880 [Kineosporia sp. NBRC 101677]
MGAGLPSWDHEDVTTNRVKVRFELEPDEGWPPVESEGLWAEPLGGGRFRIDNAPWFVPDLAAADVVEAVADSDGVLWATRKIAHGGRLAVQVIPFRSGPLNGDLQAVLDMFVPLGVSGEGAAPTFHLVALDISPDADLQAIVDRLREGERDGSWEYSEGCVTSEWLAL